VILQPQSALGTPFGTQSVVPGFNSNSTTLRECADLGCVLLTTSIPAADIVTAASQAAGVPLPLVPGKISTSPPQAPTSPLPPARGELTTGASGDMTIAPHRTAIWLSPRSWLIHCDLDQEAALVEQLNRTSPEKLLHAVAFTDHLCWFELCGTAALDLLTEGTFLSLERNGLPITHAKRTFIAQIAAIIVHNSEQTWLVAVERSRARYFADWLIAAAEARE
jgi:heterotetrameric sarcosine oxidase gamma subunit